MDRKKSITPETLLSKALEKINFVNGSELDDVVAIIEKHGRKQKSRSNSNPAPQEKIHDSVAVAKS